MIYILKNDIEICEFGDGTMKFKATDRISHDFMSSIHKLLEDATGLKWTLDILPGEVFQTIAGAEHAQKEADKRDISETPLVKAILEGFKGAKIETITRKVKQDNDDFSDDNDFFVSEDS